jgi:hypothetical protein
VGDPAAHEELGFVYSVGWGGREKNTAKAVLHQYFAALGGDARGQMAMAYRHLHGIGVPKSCQAGPSPPPSPLTPSLSAHCAPVRSLRIVPPGLATRPLTVCSQYTCTPLPPPPPPLPPPPPCVLPPSRAVATHSLTAC